jgi:hypothetical protein
MSDKAGEVRGSAPVVLPLIMLELLLVLLVLLVGLLPA